MVQSAAGLLLRFAELVTETHTLALGGCASPWAESWAGLFSYTPRDSGSAPVFPVFPLFPLWHDGCWCQEAQDQAPMRKCVTCIITLRDLRYG